jgi:predicted DNA binding protein
MLNRRMLDHISVEKIAEEFNFSVQHTSRKLNTAEKKIFLHIK